MDIDARTLACWSENAWDDAPLSANTLRPQLRLMERGAASLFASGSLGSVSKNSASQSYAGAGFGRFSVAQIQQGFRMLIELYDDGLKWTAELQSLQVAWFIAKYPNYATDPDQSVYDWMTQRLQPVDDYQVDITDLRLRPTLGSGRTLTW